MKKGSSSTLKTLLTLHFSSIEAKKIIMVYKFLDNGEKCPPNVASITAVLCDDTARLKT